MARPTWCTPVLSALALSILATLAGCSDDPDEATVRVTVLDSNDAPVPGALLGIEEGGAYQHTPDPAKGNPSWSYGAQAGANGQAQLTLPTGTYGFHSFVAGYYYGTSEVEIDSDPHEVTVKTRLLDGQMVPTVTDFALDPPAVAAGGSVTISVNAAAAAADQPLSEEVIVVIPALSICAAMDPPSAGMPGVAYPDGVYTKTLTAPSEPGSYEVWISVTSEGCVTAPPISMQLQVQ